MPYGHVLFPLLHHYDVMFFLILLQPRLPFSSHQKLVNADFCLGEIEEPGKNRLFSYHTMLKTHPNQERDNAIHHPSLPEIIEELVE